MALLFEAPDVFDLPLTKHRDLHFDFLHKPLVVDVNGEPVLGPDGKPQYAIAPYPAGAVVTIEIDTAEAVTTSDATITDHHAVIEVDYAITDPIKAKVPWRLRLIQDTWDDVVAQGRTVRLDP